MRYGFNSTGQLEYVLIGHDGCEYGVTKNRKEVGSKCKIWRYDQNACMRTDARILIWGGLLPDYLPRFDSFIGAARFLKTNIDKLT